MGAGKGGLVVRPVIVNRFVYVTITVMSVLIVYDGWQHLRLIDVAGIIFGPVLAMFIGHVFSASLALQIELERSLTGPERLRIVRGESGFLLLCVPPLALAVVLDLVGVSVHRAITVILWAGVASLGAWGGIAGRLAGFSGWHLALAVLSGLLLGAVVLALYVLLQPGKAFSGGIAVG
jgi:hypothetical protein